MSRGPSHQPYRGTLGRTQTTTVHVTGPRGDLIAAQVFTTIDAVSDPELVQRLFVDDPARALNVVRVENGDVIRVAVPVVYHDPSHGSLVLILGDSHRHRELEERIALLERMRADDSAIPPYAKNFTVVYGSAGLRALLDERLDVAADEARRADDSREVDRRRAELDGRVSELEKVRDANDRRARELERRALDLDNKDLQIDRARAELEKARGEIERLRSEARRIMIAAAAAQASAQAAQQAAAAAHGISGESNESTAITAMPLPPAARPTPAPAPANPFAEPDETRPVPLEKLDEIESNIAKATAFPEIIDESSSFSRPFQGSFADEEEREDQSRPTQALTDDNDGRATRALTDDVEAIRPTRALLDAVNERASAQALDSSTNNVAAPEQLEDSDTAGASILPPGADPLTTETRDLPEVQSDPWIEKVAARDASSVTVDQHGARLALVVGDQLARSLRGLLDVRVLLHRTRHYPVITFVIGPPPALRVVSTTQLAIVPLDIAQDKDRAFLQQLAKQFDLNVEIVVRGRRSRRVKLTAPLSENVGYILRAAEDHLRGLAAGGEGTPSYERARELVLGAGFDLLGVEHSDTPEFRDDKLAQLETAQNLRRAIAMARRFARPMREDYLVCTRGFPLPRWRELRRHVLESSVAWGLWMGPELAQVAVSEGLARSRRDLVVRLDHGFDKLKRNTAAFDIDEEAAEDNYKALAEEARALGVELAKRNGTGTGIREAISSEEVSQVSGSIGGGNTPPAGVKRQSRPSASTDELIAQLDDRSRRVGAAIELCEKGDARAAAHVIAAVAKMSRAEAVRVLGMSVKFGPAAAAPLTAGLRSSKGFLRHGCALALALLRTDDGIHAVIDLLINEPTEIWREVARAIGQVGPTGLMPLASAFGGLGSSIGDRLPQVAERVAWAMAHIAVRGGKAAVETMANGHSVMAPVARHALELHGSAARDQVRVRPGADGSQAGRDVTVNRAFSRRFFEALEQGLPEVAAAGLEALDASQPMEMLDEEDLIEDEDDGEALDESDLIQT